MNSGYLYLETHTAHPGLVRCLILDRMPSTEGKSGTAVRYIARFSDIEAAQMHFQNSLRRTLVDIDNHLYRADLATAVAAIEADDLRHEKIWMDDGVDSEEVRALTESFNAKRQRRDAAWRLVGMVALVLLLLSLLATF